MKFVTRENKDIVNVKVKVDGEGDVEINVNNITIAWILKGCEEEEMGASFLFRQLTTAEQKQIKAMGFSVVCDEVSHE